MPGGNEAETGEYWGEVGVAIFTGVLNASLRRFMKDTRKVRDEPFRYLREKSCGGNSQCKGPEVGPCLAGDPS